MKVTGPMFSMSASGTIAKAVTFAHWKGRPYVRTRVVPSNPQSSPQISIRAMMKFLSQAWAGVSAPDKATWDELAGDKSVSAFNAFVSAGLDRWSHFHGPSAYSPADDAGVAPAAPTTTVVAGVKELNLSIADGAQIPDWGWLVFRSTVTGFTPSFSNLAQVVPKTATPTVWIDKPLLTGIPYYYRVKGLMDSGLQGTLEAERTGTPT